MLEKKSFDNKSLIQVSDLCHSFGEGKLAKQVLNNIQLDIKAGEFISLVGASGSGKTTLLTLLGCLRSVQSGSINLLGSELKGASESELVFLRKKLGFIFQTHNLHESLTAIENVTMGLLVHENMANEEMEKAASHLLDILGLGEHIHYYPKNLSGGQKQRVAIARALVGNPRIIFADEPTAALDKNSSFEVVKLLQNVAKSYGSAILMVTHDQRILSYVDRVIELEDGDIISS